VNPPLPRCPVCGSSATLPFESDENSDGDQSFPQIVLTVLTLFLLLFLVFMLFLLSRASMPVVVVTALACLLFWRWKKKNFRKKRRRARLYVCLDCSRNFKA